MNDIKILLVEDDENFGAILKDYLELNEMDVVLRKDGVAGLAAFKKQDFNLCILDVMMPKKDGFTLARDIREIDKEVPLFFLTAKSLKQDILEGYRIGADDYLNKPFDVQILLQKINRIVEKQEELKIKTEKIRLGIFLYDTNTRELINTFNARRLSPKESSLLLLLATYKNQIVSREKILSKIWKGNNYFNARSMDVYISKLRKYLSEDKNIEIRNLHAHGFSLIVK